MVLRSTFDLGVPRGARAAHISAPTTFWSFTRTSGATSDFLFVTGPTALPIDVFVNRSVSCSHARPPYDHRGSPRHRTTARGVSRTTLSKWEALRAAVVFNVGVPGCPQLWSTDVPAALVRQAEPERAPGPLWLSEASGRVEQHLRR